MASVAFNGVGKVFADGTRAVKDLDLEIRDGEFMVLVGPSGCGKTTALRMVAGLEQITEGQVKIGDRVVNAIEPKERDIAMVFQNYALYPHMTVYDNIAFGLRMKKTPRARIAERVREISGVLALTEYLKRKPRQLSGGQRQRVAMGRAIVRNPSVFLMDEPLSNLDARLRVQMRAEISRIQREHQATTIYVTHDQIEAMTMGDRVAVMRKGELQQMDASQPLYDRPANLFVASFIGSPPMNLVQAKLMSRNGSFVALVGEHELVLPPATLANRPALEAYAGRTIGLGIRPEHVQSHGAAGSAAGRTLLGEVVLSEALGSERLVHLALTAEPVITDDVLEVASDADATAAEKLKSEARESRAIFVGRFDTSLEVSPGDRLEILVNLDRLHFFDLDTGNAIYATHQVAAS
jgi:multiple sugar transport system ATP-binding protein